MRFSVDAHAIGQNLTGNETYVSNLLRCFSYLDRESEFIAYVSRPDAGAGLPRSVQRRVVADNPFLRLGFDLSRQLRNDNPNLLHVQYTSPLSTGNVPIVVSVHDISYLSHPQYFTRFRRHQFRYTVRRTIARATKILTASEFSRRAIIDAYGPDEDKVVAMPYAASSRFRPVAREVAAPAVRKRFGIAAPFVLTVGDLQPRKNHLGLLRAFEDAVRDRPQLKHQLVFTGKETWYSPVIHEAVKASPVRNRVHFTGFVSDDDLVQLYGACDLFVFPSFYEGFGLPILEAMACGRAVACSNSSAIPEVADSSALLFSPESRPEMTRAILDLLLDPELRARMERLGLARAAQFSWERTARATLDVYYEVAGMRERSRARAVSVAGL
ncbi:MAG TPA: glycosyltransferase family 1 protein [Bryobacteraceae bacterium]|jgi:glycosyltransferase involved in cell wall biosynthesis|nr:glycosyltransferase family 1 protein [Bryobacteraceae bacterium]